MAEIKKIQVAGTTYDIRDDRLTTKTAYTSKGSATKVPQITTNTLGQVTGITEVTITQPTVNNAYVSLQVGGSEKTKFYANDSTNRTFNVTAADLGLSQALKFVGISTTDPKGSSGATVSGHTTWVKGEVVLYKRSSETYYEEYLNLDGSNVAASWELLGDDSSYVIKGTTTSNMGAHSHSLTATAAAQTFTGSAGITGGTSLEHTHAVTAKGTISTGTGTANYTPAGSVSQPTFSSGSAASNGAHTHTVTGNVEVPNLTYDSTNKCLNITIGSASLTSGSAASNGAHTHTVSGTVSKPSFTGTGVELKFTGSSATTDSKLGVHTHSFTPSGTNASSSVTGTADLVAGHTHTVG